MPISRRPTHRPPSSRAALEQLEERWSRIQEVRRRARENLRHLRSHPPSRWTELVEEAQSRYRSRAFAELLLVESRAVLPHDPREARHLAELVPLVLRWLPGAEGQPWADELHLRALVRRAQAVAAEGDTRTAEHDLHHLRRTLQQSGLPEPHRSRVLADLEWSAERSRT